MIEYMYMYIYNMVNLLKSHDNLHGITYRVKIMLKGIVFEKIFNNLLSDCVFLKVDDHQILHVECRPLTCCIVLIVWELRNVFTADGSVELIIF